MSATITGDYKTYNLKSKGTLFLAFVQGKDVQHAPQPFDKPYYFWDKELCFFEKPLPVKLTFIWKKGQSIIKERGYLKNTTFFDGSNIKWMYFTFENPQYDDIMKKNHKDYPDDEIKFEFSYYVESDLKVLKYYSSNSEDKKNMFPTKYNLRDHPANYSFAWKMLHTYLIRSSHKCVDCDSFNSLVLQTTPWNLKKLAQPLGKEYYFWDCDMVNEKCSIFEEPLSIMLSFHFDDTDNNCKTCYLNAKPCEEAVKTPALLHHTLRESNNVLMYVTYKNKEFRQHLTSRKEDLNTMINYMMVSFEKEPNPAVQTIHIGMRE